METFRNIFLAIFFYIFVFYENYIAQSETTKDSIQWEIFPIINYDTDVGFGYGVKGFLYNLLNSEESFDVTIYNSTKSERWYQFVFSYPDMQRRLGKKYNFAVDFTIDYDKYINYLYYPIENDIYYSLSNYEYLPLKESEEYIREPIEIKTIFSRAFTNNFIAELGIQYRSISCYNFDSEGILQYKKPSLVDHISFLFNFRIDSRTNFINPKNGILIQINNEYAVSTKSEVNNFYKADFIFQSYFKIFHPDIISATRLKLQDILGLEENNYQNLLFLGGNNSLRGLPQSRYLSQSSILLNQEIRFPIYKRFGGIVGLDAGNSTSTPKWILNPLVGLRFNMDNFIVRFDVGFGNNNTGIYFNFGHLF
ncbi:MAG: BamA/TamA family outer membrane protein [Melioribacteraceae bacterium]